jgi:Holliday junction resolvase RusA-like endonuclease
MAWNTQSVAVERRVDEDSPRSVQLSLPKPPSVNNLFVNHPHGRGRFPSGEYKAWRIEASSKVRLQRPMFFRGPVTLSLVVEEGNRCDLDNLMKAPIDLLVELGIIEGDGPGIVKQITLRHGAVTGALMTITAYDDAGPLFQKGARP